MRRFREGKGDRAASKTPDLDFLGRRAAFGGKQTPDDGKPVLHDFLRAVGPGDTDVTIEVVDLEEPVPDEFVIYRTPDPKTLQIHIPEPLVAQPTSWMDE